MWHYADSTEIACSAGTLGKTATALQGPSDRFVTFDNKQYPAAPAAGIADRMGAPVLSVGSAIASSNFHASIESYARHADAPSFPTMEPMAAAADAFVAENDWCSLADLALPDRKGNSIGENAK